MSEALLTVENLCKAYGEKELFSNISFGIAKGQKTALIAKNGTGKTSLLEIIAGNDLPDKGEVIFRNNIRIAYLPQNPRLDENLSVMEFVFSSENKFIKAVKEYEALVMQIQIDNSLANQTLLNESIVRMDSLNAWDYESRIKEILSKLQIDDVSKKIRQLSGGERKKAVLSKILIEDNDLLILDEPTNHLDINMIEWLEEFLSKQNLALLVVTHDRYFLDNVCTEILELTNGSVYKYKGNYNYFIEKKLERAFIEQQEQEKLRNTYTRELEWMRRMPSARGTKAKARIDAFYELKDGLKRANNEKIEFSVKAERIGGKILEVYNISKRFDEKVILDDFSYTFKRGEKVGVVGKNGVGKSTFLNIIMDLLNPDTGKINRGQTIKFGYYTQEGLNEANDIKVIDIIKKEAEYIKMEDGSEVSASQFLNHFGFPYPLQYTHFGSLSGGEKRKLNLLKVLISNPNFLILDEPTNDLDLYTLEALESFLQLYKGCLLIVSHDRCFMDHLIDHIFVFAGEGKVKDYHSNYTDFLKQKQRQENKSQPKEKKETTSPQPEKLKTNKPSYKQKQEYENLTNEIEELELQKSKLFEKMNESSFASHEELEYCSTQIGELIKIIDEKTEHWLELSELMD